MNRKGMKLLIASSCLYFGSSANAIPIAAGFVPASVAESGSALFYQHIQYDFEGMNGFNGRFDFSTDLVGGGYAFTKNLFAYGFIPYNENKLSIPAIPGGVLFDEKGLGDPVLGGLIRLWDKAGEGWYSSFGLNVAMSIPVGYYQNPTLFNPIPPRSAYPGRGNFVPTVGATVFAQDVNLGGLAANASFSHPAENAGYRWGNTATYNLSYSRRLVPFNLPEGEMNIILEGALELLGTWTGKFESKSPLNGNPNNSGGNNIIFAPGLALKGIGWSINASYFEPISQSFNGIQPLKIKRGFLISASYVPGAPSASSGDDAESIQTNI